MKRLLLLLLLAGPVAAQYDVDALAERLSRSPLAENITRETDPALRRATIKDWLLSDPESAAYLAAGLAQDDAEGGTRFQDVLRSSRGVLRHNPGSDKNIYGRLHRSGTDSKLLGKQSEQLSDEEKREILKTMFEGQGNQNQNIITRQDSGKSPDASAGAAAAALAGPGYFDRLSQGNLRGYSPELLVLQNALNARRPPGAPKLIESGKLDYATLSYPSHGIRFDIGNLEARLRYQRNYHLAKALGLGRAYKDAQLLDPAVEAELKAKAAGTKLDPRFQKRERALERASLALKEFDLTALAAQDPAKISRNLLSALGEKQREAARWITAASLEEELQHLENEEGFLTPELLALIDSCPFPEETRQAYKKRGEGFKARLLELKTNAGQALALLESNDWFPAIGRVEKLLAQNGVLRKDLLRDIRDYVNTPYRLAGAARPRPRWRRLLEDLLMRSLPSHPYSRKLKLQAGQKALLADVFLKIAAGDLDAAHTILASYEAR